MNSEICSRTGGGGQCLDGKQNAARHLNIDHGFYDAKTGIKQMQAQAVGRDMIPKVEKTSPKGLFDLPAAADPATCFMEKPVFVHVTPLSSATTTVFGSIP